MNDFELLAPAGDLEKLKTAILFGADAVFIGGLEFSLRARASNFTISDIKEACTFAHAHNKKVHVTTNIIPHNDNLEGLVSYLKCLEDCGVDALICASFYIMETALAYTNIDVHVSTQQSTLNIDAIRFYEKMGVKRIVLGREATLEDIKLIKENTKLEIEVFIHGGMCASYSGRCMLSNVMTDRDANRGGCAHSCRWNYDLYDGDKKINNDFFTMSCKDLEAINEIKELMALGVNSFKIEGRMKSIHYIATVVKCYKRIMNDCLLEYDIDYDYYDYEIKKAENRLTSHGFLRGMVTPNEMLYNMRSEIPTKEFVGLVLDYDKETKYATVEQRNYFLPKDTLEVFTPKEDFFFNVEEIFDESFNVLDAARHPKQILKIKIDRAVNPGDMLRKAKEIKA